MWAQLKSVSREVNLCEQEDTCTWILTKTGKFTVRSILKTHLDANWPPSYDKESICRDTKLP